MSRKRKIHINQHVIRSNHKTGSRDPVITVKDGRENDYYHEVDILDAVGNVAATIVYSPDKPLSCGARVWIETENQVRGRTLSNQTDSHAKAA